MGRSLENGKEFVREDERGKKTVGRDMTRALDCIFKMPVMRGATHAQQNKKERKKALDVVLSKPTGPLVKEKTLRGGNQLRK